MNHRGGHGWTRVAEQQGGERGVGRHDVGVSSALPIFARRSGIAACASGKGEPEESAAPQEPNEADVRKANVSHRTHIVMRAWWWGQGHAKIVCESGELETRPHRFKALAEKGVLEFKFSKSMMRKVVCFFYACEQVGWDLPPPECSKLLWL